MMKSSLIGTVKFNFFAQPKFQEILEKPHLGSSIVTCRLRKQPRKTGWRTKRISTEAIQVVQSLKLAKASRLQEVFDAKLKRLVKDDLLDTLEVLQSQNELDLALKVFEHVQKEVWYKPELSLFHHMILMLGRNKLIEMAEEFFSKIEKEGLKPDTRAFTEMIGAYLQVDMIEKAMGMYERMKASGCAPDELTFTILIRNLEDAGKEELAASIKKECGDYMDYPQKFIEELERKKDARRKWLKLV
uniref:Pentatricopeptide repeat-containing protein n=1 Tax=Rhizophora mucronata TaxID=61149 RepID=A0A2P2IKA9_RHIMU